LDNSLSYRLESAEWLPSLDLIDTLQHDRPEAGAEREMVAGGWMMYAGPQSPINHVIGMGLVGPVSSQEFDRVEDFYRRHESICEVVVSPYSDMSLTGHVGARGYRVTEWNSVMFRELDPAQGCETHGVEVRAVGPGEAREWSALVARGFGDLTGVSAELFVPFATAPNAICFIAYVDGHPAGGAGGSVFPEAGIAPFYGASTLEEFRNRSVQNALFQARLHAASAAGCELAVVCTAPGSVSERNARRNGFRLAYTKAVFQRHV
jgi:hypothetical protein